MFHVKHYIKKAEAVISTQSRLFPGSASESLSTRIISVPVQAPFRYRRRSGAGIQNKPERPTFDFISASEVP